MRRHSTATLMGMTKKELVDYVRMAEHNEDTAMAALEQQAENVKDWEPINPELRRAIKLLHAEYEKAKKNPVIRNPLGRALYVTWMRYQ